MALTIKKIHKLSGSLGAGIFTANLTIPVAVDTSKSFAILYARCNSSTDVSQGHATCQITSSTNVEVRRENAGAVTMTVYVEVWEILSGGSVSRGNLVCSVTPISTTIPAVDLTKAFPIVTARMSGNPGNGLGNSMVRTHLSSTTAIAFYHNATPQIPIVEWQVIELDDATVTAKLGTLLTQAAELIPIGKTVDIEKTLVFGSFWNAGNNNIDSEQIKATQLFDTTNVRCASYTASTLDYAIYVVEIPNIKVQKIYKAFTGSSDTTDITAVDDIDLTGINGPGQYAYWGLSQTTTENTDLHNILTKFNGASTSQLIHERGSAAASAVTVSNNVVEFNVSPPAPPSGDGGSYFNISKFKFGF